MRTTITIDDYILQAAKAAADLQKHTIGEVLSDWARNALMRHRKTAGGTGFRFCPCKNGGRSYDGSGKPAAKRTALTNLLGVNVMIALIDPAHVVPTAASAWFGTIGQVNLATCRLSENGVIKIVESSVLRRRKAYFDVRHLFGFNRRIFQNSFSSV